MNKNFYNKTIISNSRMNKLYLLIIGAVIIGGFLWVNSRTMPLNEQELISVEQEYSDFLLSKSLINDSVSLSQDIVDNELHFIIEVSLSINQSRNYVPISYYASWFLEKWTDSRVTYDFYYNGSQLIMLTSKKDALDVINEYYSTDENLHEFLPEAFTVITHPGCDEWICDEWSSCEDEERRRSCLDSLCGFSRIEKESCRRVLNYPWNEFEAFFYSNSTFNDAQKQDIVNQTKNTWIAGEGIINSVQLIEEDYYFVLQDPSNIENVHVAIIFSNRYASYLEILGPGDVIKFNCMIDMYNLNMLILVSCEPVLIE